MYVIHNVHILEFLNTSKCSRVPNNEINMKVRTPVMLLKNIDHSLRLCNVTRLVVTRLGKHIMGAKILTGSNFGKNVLIFRLSITSSDSRLPFKFNEDNFFLLFCILYAMTTNKSQQSLSYVDLFLMISGFSHGQLYVAVSRIRSR